MQAAQTSTRNYYVICGRDQCVMRYSKSFEWTSSTLCIDLPVDHFHFQFHRLALYTL